MNTAKRYAIKDLERLSGIKAHTIRIWEKRYNIIRPGRSGTNIRYYNDDDLRQILNISLLNKNGFKISAIAAMSADELNNRLSAISHLTDPTDGIQENLLLSLLELSELKFNQALVSAIIKWGFEQAFVNMIFPFFERIGVMWQTGTISAAQEHFFSNLIRQKLISATDRMDFRPVSDANTVLLFLPENEQHEIALLFYNYAFRRRGYHTIYLGQSVPFGSIKSAVETILPDIVVTGMTSAMNPLDFNEYISALNALYPTKKVFYTGPIPEDLLQQHSEILTVKQLRELLDI